MTAPRSDTQGPRVRPDAPVERIELDDRSWVEVTRGWVDAADELYDAVTDGVAWQQGRLFRYERWIEEPRLTAWCAAGPNGVDVPHPALVDVHRAVRQRYGKPFEGFAMNWYRTGSDSQAFHRDRDLRWLDDTVIALLSLGARRSFLLRPRAGRYDHEAPARGATHDLAPGPGDLVVMGGATQVGWEHGVPKMDPRTPGRVSLQWRWTSRRGRPEQGASYRAPRHFSR